MNFSLWTSIGNEVAEKIIAFGRANRKERRSQKRQAEQEQEGIFRFRFGICRGKRQVFLAVIAVRKLPFSTYALRGGGKVKEIANFCVQ